jgi:cytochrome c peroxidase
MRIAWVIVLAAACSTNTSSPSKEQLGRLVFEDPNLSNPSGQACSDCHASRAAFRDPESDHAQSMGVVPGRFGFRNAPTIMYSRFVPPLHRDTQLGSVGGLFWDGRAATLEDQIGGPLLNPLEMNNPDKATVVEHIRASKYAAKFRDIYGAHVFDTTDRAYTAITEVLAAFERSSELAPFNSRYDRYLAGSAILGPSEQRGLEIFEDPARGNCASCHPSRPGPDGAPPLFTNFAYANLGVPRYANNKFYEQTSNRDGANYIDRGLAVVTGSADDEGKFRTPTLRDIAKTGPYGHNGYFQNLPYALEFFANRDAGSFDVGTCSRTGTTPTRCPWPTPEIATTLDHGFGHHTLSPQDLDDLAAFLGTLTDELD